MEQRETAFSLFARRIMEACWLLALAIIPIYFSLLSDRHFEPDKATVLRSLALIIMGAWAVYVLERGQAYGEWPRWRAWRKAPMLVPTLVYVGVFFLASLTSILIWTSFWGGYNRLQGFFTNFSYIIIFGAMLANVRRREQLERIITVIVATALPTLMYGVLQHNSTDPLPWAGDTAARVASTMGNSIFVAAYLILVLPFMLYRAVAHFYRMRHSNAALYAERDIDQAEAAQEAPSTLLDLAWMAAFGLLAFAQIALFYGILKIGALLQGPITDFPPYWWLYPLATVAIGSTSVLYTFRLSTTAPRNAISTYLPGALVLLMLVGMLLGGYLTLSACPTSGSITKVCENTRLSTYARAENYRLWLGLGGLALMGFYALITALPRRISHEGSRLMHGVTALACAGLALFNIYIIFLTQSRGPQMGMFAGIFTFITLALLQAWRTWRNKLYLGLMSAWLLLVLAGGGFLVVLNTTSAFSGLRENPYIARLGNLLETDGGTGKVRVLIWRGDSVTRGAVDLILADPLRTVIGWGPETMFMAYNPYYPPELANYESRGASPDRSHQTMLDELVNKGALGLFSHLFLFGSFAVLMLRLLQIRRIINLALVSVAMLGIAAFFTIFIESAVLGVIALIAGAATVGLAAWLGYAQPLRRPIKFGWQLLVIACAAGVVSNFGENTFGIPIVSSLLYTWVIMAVGVLSGKFAGVYELGKPQVAAVVETVEPEAPEKPSAGGTRRQRQASRNQRQRGRTSTAGAPARIVYPVVLVGTLIAIWFYNLDGIYADMRYMQSKQLLEQANSFEAHILSYAALEDAISAAPHEDLYYLSMGRVLMTLATDVSIQQGELINTDSAAQQVLAKVVGRQPSPDASLDDLPSIDYSQAGINAGVQEFIKGFSPFQLLDYARLALEEAEKLNPGNKDHPANLGRLHASWFRNIQQSDPTNAQKHLDAAIANYEKAHAIAPQDVELTGQWAMLYTYTSTPERANEILTAALQLDPTYSLNLARMAELQRRAGDYQAAADNLKVAVVTEPQPWNATLDVAELQAERQERINQTKTDILDKPDLREIVLEGYPKGVERRPDNLAYRLQYAQVLSNTLQYDRAAQVATEALERADTQAKPSANHVKALQDLLEYVKQQLF